MMEEEEKRDFEYRESSPSINFGLVSAPLPTIPSSSTLLALSPNFSSPAVVIRSFDTWKSSTLGILEPKPTSGSRNDRKPEQISRDCSQRSSDYRLIYRPDPLYGEIHPTHHFDL